MKKFLDKISYTTLTGFIVMGIFGWILANMIAYVFNFPYVNLTKGLVFGLAISIWMGLQEFFYEVEDEEDKED